jgi:mRNA-degrading endonuclease toxin of MazEF toxin-antitoxin module
MVGPAGARATSGLAGVSKHRLRVAAIDNGRTYNDPNQRGIKAEVPLGPDDGLRRAFVANLDSLHTVGQHVLEERIGGLQPEKLRTVNDALRYALGLDEPVV